MHVIQKNRVVSEFCMAYTDFVLKKTPIADTLMGWPHSTCFAIIQKMDIFSTKEMPTFGYTDKSACENSTGQLEKSWKFWRKLFQKELENSRGWDN